MEPNQVKRIIDMSMRQSSQLLNTTDLIDRRQKALMAKAEDPEREDMPFKIPVEGLLQHSQQELRKARTEIGALKAYIDEQEHEIASLKKEIKNLKEADEFSKAERRAIIKEARQTEYVAQLRDMIGRETRRNKDLMKTLHELLYRLAQGGSMTESQMSRIEKFLDRNCIPEGLEDNAAAKL